jgi:hypothetical protein
MLGRSGTFKTGKVPFREDRELFTSMGQSTGLSYKDRNPLTISMPLSNIKTQCIAIARSTGNRCLNPKIGNCRTCKSHGGRKNILVGIDHPNYKHGLDTKEAIVERKTKFAELNQLAISLGV